MMKPARLRQVVQRYGDLGLVLVGLYLAGHAVWTKRRIHLILLLLALVLCGIIVRPGRLHVRRLDARRAEPTVPAAAAYRASPHPERSLLAHASMAVALDKYYRAHFWVSPDRLLLVSGDRPASEYGDTDSADTEGWTGHADTLDWRTGRRRRLAGLTRVFHHMHATPGEFETSPGGTWLKWINYETPDGWPFAAVARWDGSGFQQWGQDKFSETYWLDDRRWIEEEVRGGSEIIVHDVEHQTTAHLKRQSAPGQRILRWRHAKRVLEADESVEYRTARRDTVTILERADLTDSPPLRTYTIHLPRRAQVDEPLVSPGTRRVLYVLRFPDTAERVHRQPAEVVQHVLTSRLDGSDWKDLGYVVTDGQEHDDYREAARAKTLTSMEWLPDGKHFTFVYCGKLYLAAGD